MNILKSKKLSQLEGNVGKESFKTSFLLKSTLRISIPAALETFLVGLMGMIDTMMVGQYSTEAFAAVSIAQQPVYITLAASVGFNAGIIAIVSRRKGENDPKSANQVLRHTLIIGMIVSILITILAIVFARPFLWLVGAQDDTIDFATTYFRFVSAGLIFNYIR